MNSRPIISILTPTYNRAKTFLMETIESVQKQSEQGFTHEHIIADNASEDRTEEVVRRYMITDPRIRYIKNDKNLYASGALNVAFEHSRGDLIVPLDDDDVLPPLSLQVRFDEMRNNPHLQWTSGRALFIDPESRPIASSDRYVENILPYLDKNKELLDPEMFFLALLEKWLIFNGTVTIRRECIETVGKWDPEFTEIQDLEMWTKLAAKHYEYKFLDDCLLFYRLHENQATKKNIKNWDHFHQKLDQRYAIIPKSPEKAVKR